MVKSRKAGVDTPTVYFVDEVSRRLFIEFIEGITVKQYLFNGISETGKHLNIYGHL